MAKQHGVASSYVASASYRGGGVENIGRQWRNSASMATTAPQQSACRLLACAYAYRALRCRSAANAWRRAARCACSLALARSTRAALCLSCALAAFRARSIGRKYQHENHVRHQRSIKQHQAEAASRCSRRAWRQQRRALAAGGIKAVSVAWHQRAKYLEAAMSCRHLSILTCVIWREHRGIEIMAASAAWRSAATAAAAKRNGVASNVTYGGIESGSKCARNNASSSSAKITTSRVTYGGGNAHHRARIAAQSRCRSHRSHKRISCTRRIARCSARLINGSGGSTAPSLCSHIAWRSAALSS